MLRPSPMNRAAGAALIAGSGLSSVCLSSAACEPIRLVNSTRSAPPGGHYSHAVVTPPGASHVFVSGMLPITPEGKKLVSRNILRWLDMYKEGKGMKCKLDGKGEVKIG